MINYATKTYHRLALIHNKTMHYDVCGHKRTDYDKKKFHYIGKGIIHSINGVKQFDKNDTNIEELHFFIRINRHLEHLSKGEVQKHLLTQAQSKIGIGRRGFSFRG